MVNSEESARSLLYKVKSDSTKDGASDSGTTTSRNLPTIEMLTKLNGHLNLRFRSTIGCLEYVHQGQRDCQDHGSQHNSQHAKHLQSAQYSEEYQQFV
jgi:hypothetical protein